LASRSDTCVVVLDIPLYKGTCKNECSHSDAAGATMAGPFYFLPHIESRLLFPAGAFECLPVFFFFVGFSAGAASSLSFASGWVLLAWVSFLTPEALLFGGAFLTPEALLFGGAFLDSANWNNKSRHRSACRCGNAIVHKHTIYSVQ
jgi:hypothetical protein